VIVYAESSAVLAWLLGEPAAPAVRQLLAEAERVVSSTLTPLESDRALARGVALATLTATDAREAGRLLRHATRGWALLELTGPLLDRAARPFPAEPVRTLDALHLATALEFEAALGGLTMLSLDARIRENATALGMEVGP
jgi:predicted nucleic acid-binding protein